MCRPSSLNTRRLALRRSDLSSLREVPAFPSLLSVLPRCKKVGGGGKSTFLLCGSGCYHAFLACCEGLCGFVGGYSFVCLFVLQNRVSQHSSDCLGIHPTEQTGLEFRDVPDSAF